MRSINWGLFHERSNKNVVLNFSSRLNHGGTFNLLNRHQDCSIAQLGNNFLNYNIKEMCEISGFMLTNSTSLTVRWRNEIHDSIV